jgi:hypothetical protein
VEARLGNALDGAGVDSEMSGKDLIDSGPGLVQICRVLCGARRRRFSP